MDSIHLHGAEDVRTAASRMVEAADVMQRAASTIDAALDRQRSFLDDWLQRFEIAMQPAPRKCKCGRNEATAEHECPMPRAPDFRCTCCPDCQSDCQAEANHS